MKYTALVMIAGFSAISAVHAAAPYQFEGGIGIVRGDTSSGGNSNDFDGFIVGGEYYLRPVNTGVGPLHEAAFLDKAANIGLALLRIDPDFGGERDTMTLDGRFVTSQNFIIEPRFSRLDIDGASDTSDTMSLGVGKYLDDWADVIVSFSTNDDADVDRLGIETRRVNTGTGIDTWWAYELGATYIDAPDDNGYGVSIGGLYYPSAQLALGADFDYTSVGDFDTQGISFEAEYFFTEQFYGSLGYSTDDNDAFDTDTLFIAISGRF